MGDKLSSEEFEAIQSAMGKGRRSTPAEDLELQAEPIALIADDRAAERARPNAQKIAARWIKTIPQLITRLCRIDVEATVQNVEVVDGGGLRNALGESWVRCLRVDKRSDLALMTASGPMVEIMSACLLGAQLEQSENDRPPSQVARQLFGRVGEAITRGLTDAWFEEQGCSVNLLDDAARAELWRRSLSPGDLVVSTTIAIEGDTRGTIGLITRPETMVVPPVPVGSVPAPPGAVEAALGSVPVEVNVELGRVRMTMNALSRLQPGTILPLDKFLDDPLPIRVGGKIKGHGRALVSRGTMAVEVIGNINTKGRPS